MRRWVTWVLVWCLLGGAQAVEAPALSEDPVLEQRLIGISNELRCLVCQNESLAGSRADLALDLRREIRTQIRAGKTDEQILSFMVERYGDFVRYRPPFNPVTWLLWLGPFGLLGAGVWMLVRMGRGRPSAGPAQPVLDDAQRAKARALLRDTER
jgi:cytochrome c-type biogenesis protein CcmH